MKVKPNNNQTKRQRTDRKSKIAKQIEIKLQKQYFFKEVKQQIEKQFAKDDLQFLLEHFKNIIIHNKRKIYQTEQSNTMQSIQDHETANQPETNKEETNPLRKIDTNIFRSGLKKPVINQLLFNIQQNTQYFSTPKFRKQLSRDIYTRNIFERNPKIQKSYQHQHNKSKQCLNNNYQLLKTIKNCRTSQITYRLSKTQRTPRYKTETQQKNIAFEQQSIPLIISGDLFHKSQMKKHNKQILQQKRMQCFLNNRPISQNKKYPTNY